MILAEALAPPQVLYNNKGYHSMPTYLNSLNNAILRANLPKSKGNPAAYGKESQGRGMGDAAELERHEGLTLPFPVQVSPSPTTP